MRHADFESHHLDESAEEAILTHTVVRLNAMVLGIVLGVVIGMMILLATLWLVLKGGENVGAHLSLLNNFYWGYSVTLSGSVVGLLYGFLTGFLGGVIIAWIYNAIARITT